MSYPLSSEQKALKARARELAETFRGRAAHWDRTEEYPWENVKDLVKAGFMGMTAPKASGGGGRTIFDALLVIEEVAKACGVTGRIVVEGNLGAVSAVIHYGSEPQKRRWLPMVVEGDKPAICITEPEREGPRDRRDHGGVRRSRLHARAPDPDHGAPRHS